MKTSKVSAVFLSKFSAFLSKFKQSSTIAIAHQQIRKLFSEYKFSEIAIAFASKMDSCDQLSDKQKKEYIKIYISLIDVYGQDIVLQFYDRIIDSIAKKGAGVSEVVGHLCRSLLKRIYPTQNIANYIKHLLISFQRHAQIGKILKQIVESFDSEIIAPFQTQIAGLINEKIQNAKAQLRIQLLQATLALILSLQSKLFEQAVVQSFVFKNFKNDQWNVRKLCVDISYALLVINNQANKLLNQGVNELKYDKIKHVRDSVGNYTNLYKQIYGDQKQKQKAQQKTDRGFKTQRDSAVDKKRTFTSKSPVLPQKFKQRQAEQKSAPKSLQKSIKNAQRNQQFFQNARNKDVIKVSESKSFVFADKNIGKEEKSKRRSPTNHNFSQTYILQRQDHHIKQEEDPKKSEENSINFQKYLKNRSQVDGLLTYSPSQKKENIVLSKERISLNESPKQVRNMYESAVDSVKLKNADQRIVDSQLIQDNYPINSSLQVMEIKKQLKGVTEKFSKFTVEILSIVRSLQRRVAALEENRNKSLDISQMSLASLQKDIKEIKHELGNSDRYLQQSFDQRFNDQKAQNKDKKFAKKEQHNTKNERKTTENKQQVCVESNLIQKIQHSIRENNWNQAFSLALTNTSRSCLIQVLKYYQVPKDKLVQECLFVELRRNLGSWIVLKWLTTFFQEHQLPKQKLLKLYRELEASEFKLEIGDSFESGQKNYSMLKAVLLNEMKSKLFRVQSFEDTPIVG